MEREDQKIGCRIPIVLLTPLYAISAINVASNCHFVILCKNTQTTESPQYYPWISVKLSYFSLFIDTLQGIHLSAEFTSLRRF